VWDGGRWRFVDFNRNSGKYQTFWALEKELVVDDGEQRTISKWVYFYSVSLDSDAENLFRRFGFIQSASKGQGKKTTSSEPEKPVDFSVLNNSLKSCVPELWPWFEVTGFTPTSPPSPSAHPKDDRYNGVVNLRDKDTGTTFNVVNDPTLTPELKALLIARPARGATDKSNPWWNYAYPKGDPSARAGDLRYPELFGAISMEYVRVQIHELGVSLSAIRDIYHPGPGIPILPNDLDPGHEDDGPALEDCVGKKYYQQMGLKPHLGP